MGWQGCFNILGVIIWSMCLGVDVTARRSPLVVLVDIFFIALNVYFLVVSR